jgi:DNA-binding GntR family transcriptional regulator
MDEDEVNIKPLVAKALAKNGVVVARIIDPTTKDPIAQLVIEALFVNGASSITQISEYVREAKGTSSRTTVRARIGKLETEGIVSTKRDARRFVLAEKSLRKLWEFLQS